MLSLLVGLTLKWWWNTDGIKLHCVALQVAVTQRWTVYMTAVGNKGDFSFFFVFFLLH